MALKIGRLEIGYRLLSSLTAIAIAYGWVGSQLSTLFYFGDYLGLVFLFILALAGTFAIPQSVGGLLAAIAAGDAHCDVSSPPHRTDEGQALSAADGVGALRCC